jgi:hypothetical protein
MKSIIPASISDIKIQCPPVDNRLSFTIDNLWSEILWCAKVQVRSCTFFNVKSMFHQLEMKFITSNLISPLSSESRRFSRFLNLCI